MQGAHDHILNLLFSHACLNRTNALGFGLIRFDIGLEVLALLLLHLNGLANILEHLVHLLHFLTHSLNLLLRGLQRRIVVAFFQELRINGFGKPLCHLLRSRPIHVLNKQIARHAPKLRIALQQLCHCLQRFLPLGCITRPSGNHHIVLANPRVVDFLNHNASLIHNLLNRHLLTWVNLDHLGLTIQPNNPGNALGVVNLGN